MTAFADELAGTLERMLEWRSSVGYAESTYRCTLGPFLEYCAEAWPGAGALAPEMVDGWLALKGFTANSQAVFVGRVREYARFANFEGRADFVPGEEYTVRREAYQPYLFADSELAAVFRALDSYASAAHNGAVLLPELVVPVWARLLYCSGLRPQEPPALLRADVDAGTGDLCIRQTKRSRDRHVIMSADMAGLCARYDALCDPGRTWFFERFDGRPYDAQWFCAIWHRAIARGGVRLRGRARPYDLRHAFATRNLARWIDAGNDAMSLLPALSAYLGHADLNSTLYYVHLLPERLRASAGVDWELLSAASVLPGGGAPS